MKAFKWIGYALLVVGLSLAVISALAPLPDRNAAPAVWHTVATWHGDGSRSTRTFAVTGPWRVVWKTRPGRLGAGPFKVFVYDDSGNAVGVAADVTGQHRAARVLDRSGSYYLEIVGMQPYTVSVQEQA